MNWKRYISDERRPARRIGLLALLLAILASGCKEEIPNVFIIPNRATDRDFVTFQGARYISFELEENFPASKSIQEISEALQKQGWQPLKQMFLTPENPSSLATGWNYREDKKANQFVYEWSADWKDSENNIINYTFRYIDGMEKYRKSTFVLRPSSDELKVSAIYMPANVAAIRKKHAAASDTSKF